MEIEKFMEREESLIADPWVAPVLQVGEIDIRSEILAAHVLIDCRAGDGLLEKVAAEGAMRAAVIEG